MRKGLFVCLAALALASCSTNTKRQEDSNKLKVLSWNVWHAGHSKAFPEKGCEGALGILKHSNADVITMIETYGSADQVADHLGFYHRLLSSNLSIYSRYPIVETYTFPDSISTFNFGGVMINKNGQKIRVFDTWLHYLPGSTSVPRDKSEEEILAWETAGTRDEEVKKVVTLLKPFLAESDSIPVFVSGDFNVHSHLDWTEEVKDYNYHGGKVVNWPVSVTMIEAGFKDSFREMNPDVKKNYGVSWIVNDKEHPDYKGDRIDFIYYAGKNTKVVESNVYNQDLGKILDYDGKQFFYSSDHGFVTSTFEIK